MFKSTTPQLKWTKTPAGWRSRCGRFQITRSAGPSPAWQLHDARDGTALVDVRVWMLKIIAGRR